MNDPATPAAPPVLPLAGILTAISDLTRWRILDELLKGEPLPVKELARRLGVSDASTFALLAAVGGDCAGALSLHATEQRPKPSGVATRPQLHSRVGCRNFQTLLSFHPPLARLS
jgi:hypothetical protein